jgi:hypothetical protein
MDERDEQLEKNFFERFLTDSGISIDWIFEHSEKHSLSIELIFSWNTMHESDEQFEGKQS